MEKTLYTSRQIFWGTLFGGPITLIYLLVQNFRVLEKPKDAQKTLNIALPITLALLLLVVIIPMRISSPVFIACAVAGEGIARNKQFQKSAILEECSLQPTWKVVLVASACLLAWGVTCFLAIFFLEITGFTIEAI